MKTVGLIFARGGSVTVPRKNLRELGGKPLVAHTIEQAKSSILDRVIVSTDDSEIAEVARDFGAEVPFLRPSGIAMSTSSIGEGVQHALEWLKEHESLPDITVIMYPTHPFRKPELINMVVNRLIDFPDMTCCAVAVSTHKNVWWRVRQGPRPRRTEKSELQSGYERVIPGRIQSNRQHSEPLFIVNQGVATAVRSELAIRGELYGDDVDLVIDETGLSWIDIDNMLDFRIAEQLFGLYEAARSSSHIIDRPGITKCPATTEFYGILKPVSTRSHKL